MKFRKNQAKEDAAAVELFIKSAQQHVGYTAELVGKNKFGFKVGYDSQPWAGAFVDVVAREAGLKLPSFVSTSAALAEFIRSGNFSRVPQPGAIAIFNFSSNVGHAADPFGQPHCGVVTDVREFSSSGRFITIEGNTEGSTSHTKKDGVHQKIRSINEVLVFCHPQWNSNKKKHAGSQTFNEWLIRTLDRGRTKFDGSDLQEIEAAARVPQKLDIQKEIRPGDRNRKIEVIQLALATVTDLRGAEPGKWDGITTAACARYQRVIGFVGADADGLPDVNTLKRLARDTGLFELA